MQEPGGGWVTTEHPRAWLQGRLKNMESLHRRELFW